MTKQDAPADPKATDTSETKDGLTFAVSRAPDGVRVRGSDGEGNVMTVVAESKEKAKEAVIAAFKNLKGDK